MSKLLKQLKQQLEEKDKALEEKDKEIEKLNFVLRIEKDYYTNSYKQNIQLKQQLEEEKNRNKKLNHEAQKYYEDAYCNDFQNQKAIAVLEKVQKYIVEDAKPVIGYPYLKNSVMILNFICDQIKSLKGEPKC